MHASAAHWPLPQQEAEIGFPIRIGSSILTRSLLSGLHVVKVNAQVHQHSDGFLSATKSLWKTGGIAAMIKGNFTDCIRLVPHYYIQSTSLPLLKDKWKDLGSTWSSIISLCLAELITYPLLTIQTRLRISNNTSWAGVMTDIKESSTGTFGSLGGLWAGSGVCIAGLLTYELGRTLGSSGFDAMVSPLGRLSFFH